MTIQGTGIEKLPQLPAPQLLVASTIEKTS
jgi:hypothetical protein